MPLNTQISTYRPVVGVALGTSKSKLAGAPRFLNLVGAYWTGITAVPGEVHVPVELAQCGSQETQLLHYELLH